MKAAEFDYTRYTNYSPHWVAGAISESSRLKNLITALIDCVVEQRDTLQAICDEKELRTYFASEATLKATDDMLKPWLGEK